LLGWNFLSIRKELAPQSQAGAYFLIVLRIIRRKT
jgi:hypothetical protein